MPEKLFYCGKDIEDMSREELLEAIRHLHQMNESTVKSMREMNKTWSTIARAGRRR